MAGTVDTGLKETARCESVPGVVMEAVTTAESERGQFSGEVERTANAG